MIIITQDTCVPTNEETERLRKLIGCALTRIEIRDGGVIYLEFDPAGSIMVTPQFTYELFTRLSAIQ